jgi:hypothetical protein
LNAVQDLGGVFLETMKRVIDEGGFEFITTELEKQYVMDQTFLSKQLENRENQLSSSESDSELEDLSSSFGVGVILVDGSHFGSLSTSERVNHLFSSGSSFSD